MKQFEISVYASDYQEGNRREFGKPFREYRVIAESADQARELVNRDLDLEKLPHKSMACIDKGDAPDETTPRISKIA